MLKWEGLAPLALYPSAQQTSGIGLGRLFGGQDSSMRDRARMLRQGCVGGCAAAGRGWKGSPGSRPLPAAALHGPSLCSRIYLACCACSAQAGALKGQACFLERKQRNLPPYVSTHACRHPCRAITRGALQALAYCHDAGVVHGALGSGSVMLSTFDDRSHQRLVVKLDNVRRGAVCTLGCSLLLCRAAGGGVRACTCCIAFNRASAEALCCDCWALQFGFARKISVSGRSGRAPQQQGSRDALFPQPAPLATDDTPLALGQVRCAVP